MSYNSSGIFTAHSKFTIISVENKKSFYFYCKNKKICKRRKCPNRLDSSIIWGLAH